MMPLADRVHDCEPAPASSATPYGDATHPRRSPSVPVTREREAAARGPSRAMHHHASAHIAAMAAARSMNDRCTQFPSERDREARRRRLATAAPTMTEVEPSRRCLPHHQANTADTRMKAWTTTVARAESADDDCQQDRERTRAASATHAHRPTAPASRAKPSRSAIERNATRKRPQKPSDCQPSPSTTFQAGEFGYHSAFSRPTPGVGTRERHAIEDTRCPARADQYWIALGAGIAARTAANRARSIERSATIGSVPSRSGCRDAEAPQVGTSSTAVMQGVPFRVSDATEDRGSSGSRTGSTIDASRGTATRHDSSQRRQPRRRAAGQPPVRGVGRRRGRQESG